MSQNKRYHKKSHLSPRPASKFFFISCPWLILSTVKVGCFPMVIWPEFHTGQYRDGDHREDAPHFNFLETPESVNEPTDTYMPPLFVEFDFFRNRNSSQVKKIFSNGQWDP